MSNSLHNLLTRIGDVTIERLPSSKSNSNESDDNGMVSELAEDQQPHHLRQKSFMKTNKPRMDKNIMNEKCLDNIGRGKDDLDESGSADDMDLEETIDSQIGVRMERRASYEEDEEEEEDEIDGVNILDSLPLEGCPIEGQEVTEADLLGKPLSKLDDQDESDIEDIEEADVQSSDDESKEDSKKRKGSKNEGNRVKKKQKKDMDEKKEAPESDLKSDKKTANMRRNIREVMDETQLDEATLAAQRQEMERLRRVQEQQRFIREVRLPSSIQLKVNAGPAQASLSQHSSNLMAQKRPMSELIRLQGGKTSILNVDKVPPRNTPQANILQQRMRMMTPSVSISPVVSKKEPNYHHGEELDYYSDSDMSDIEPEELDDEDIFISKNNIGVKSPNELEPRPVQKMHQSISDDTVEKSKEKNIVTISSSSESSDDDCIVLSDEEEEIDNAEDDPSNSGMHTNDRYNVPDEQGRILINVGHPDNEPDVFLPPQLTRIIKPHQIGGIKFLYDNIIESIERYKNSSGFGCILAHSMGLGKTLQVASFCDIFFRCTDAKTVLCIMPINTLQNWLAEFNMWLPYEDPNKATSENVNTFKTEIKEENSSNQNHLLTSMSSNDSSNLIQNTNSCQSGYSRNVDPNYAQDSQQGHNNFSNDGYPEIKTEPTSQEGVPPFKQYAIGENSQNYSSVPENGQANNASYPQMQNFNQYGPNSVNQYPNYSNNTQVNQTEVKCSDNAETNSKQSTVKLETDQIIRSETNAIKNETDIKSEEKKEDKKMPFGIDVPTGIEFRPRHFHIHILNDSHKTMKARANVIRDWQSKGGVLLIGYELYRQLSLKKPKKAKKKRGQFLDDNNEVDQKSKDLLDEMQTALVNPGPDLVICDEGHRIKNSHASISLALKQMRTKRRIVLTGYPLQNNLLEYWCMVDFVRPNYLGTKSEFCNMFERPIQNGQCIDSTPQDIRLMRYRAHVLHALLEGFVQRRSHSVLQMSLPKKEEYILLVRMTAFQRKLYDVFMNQVVKTRAVPNPLKAFAVCCKIWNHPDILYHFLKKRQANEEDDLDLEETIGDKVVTNTDGTVTTTKRPKGRQPKAEGGAKRGRKPKNKIDVKSTTTAVINENSESSQTSTSTMSNSNFSNSNPPTPFSTSSQQAGYQNFQTNENQGNYFQNESPQQYNNFYNSQNQQQQKFPKQQQGANNQTFTNYSQQNQNYQQPGSQPYQEQHEQNFNKVQNISNPRYPGQSSSQSQIVQNQPNSQQGNNYQNNNPLTSSQGNFNQPNYPLYQGQNYPNNFQQQSHVTQTNQTNYSYQQSQLYGEQPHQIPPNYQSGQTNYLQNQQVSNQQSPQTYSANQGSTPNPPIPGNSSVYPQSNIQNNQQHNYQQSHMRDYQNTSNTYSQPPSNSIQQHQNYSNSQQQQPQQQQNFNSSLQQNQGSYSTTQGSQNLSYPQNQSLNFTQPNPQVSNQMYQRQDNNSQANNQLISNNINMPSNTTHGYPSAITNPNDKMQSNNSNQHEEKLCYKNFQNSNDPFYNKYHGNFQPPSNNKNSQQNMQQHQQSQPNNQQQTFNVPQPKPKPRRIKKHVTGVSAIHAVQNSLMGGLINEEVDEEELVTSKKYVEDRSDDELMDENEYRNHVALNSYNSSGKEEPGIPYEWAVELMKDFVPGLMEASAKMTIFFCILQEAIKLGDRVLTFSQSLFTLNLIEDFLARNNLKRPDGTEDAWVKNINYYRLDGSTSALEREKLINEFNKNPKIHLFLVSTRAGSLGINLVGANRAIVFDVSWNPCHDTQAVCRIYRYGQQKPCYVYRLVTDNSLERKIYDRQISKQGMSDRVVDQCNPDAHLSLKEATTLSWEWEEDGQVQDFSKSKDKYSDTIMHTVLDKYSPLLTKEPFQHESLLVDRKDKKLSQAEKRLARRGYELEKMAAVNARPSYNYLPGNTLPRGPVTNANSLQMRPMRGPSEMMQATKPVASVRPMQQRGAEGLPSRSLTGSRWIPAEVWQRQGMSAQEMTLPLDVVIPTNSPDKGSIVLKAGQRVMVLKSPKGIYMQLESGKIIAIRTALKLNEQKKESVEPKKVITPSPSPRNTNKPSDMGFPLKNNAAVSLIPKTISVSSSTSTPSSSQSNTPIAQNNRSLIKPNISPSPQQQPQQRSQQQQQPQQQQPYQPKYRPFIDKGPTKRTKPIATGTAKPYITNIQTVTNPIPLPRLSKAKNNSYPNQQPLSFDSTISGENSNSSSSDSHQPRLRNEHRVEEVHIDDVALDSGSNHSENSSKSSKRSNSDTELGLQKVLDNRENYPVKIHPMQNKNVRHHQGLPERKLQTESKQKYPVQESNISKTQSKVSTDQSHQVVQPASHFHQSNAIRQNQPIETQRTYEPPKNQSISSSHISNDTNNATNVIPTNSSNNTVTANQQNIDNKVPESSNIDPHRYPYTQYPRYYDYPDPHGRPMADPYSGYYPPQPISMQQPSNLPHDIENSLVNNGRQLEKPAVKVEAENIRGNTMADDSSVTYSTGTENAKSGLPNSQERNTGTSVGNNGEQNLNSQVQTSQVREDPHIPTAFTHPSTVRYPSPYPPAPYDPYGQHYAPPPANAPVYPPSAAPAYPPYGAPPYNADYARMYTPFPPPPASDPYAHNRGYAAPPSASHPPNYYAPFPHAPPPTYANYPYLPSYQTPNAPAESEPPPQ